MISKSKAIKTLSKSTSECEDCVVIYLICFSQPRFVGDVQKYMYLKHSNVLVTWYHWLRHGCYDHWQVRSTPLKPIYLLPMLERQTTSRTSFILTISNSSKFAYLKLNRHGAINYCRMNSGNCWWIWTFKVSVQNTSLLRIMCSSPLSSLIQWWRKWRLISSRRNLDWRFFIYQIHRYFTIYLLFVFWHFPTSTVGMEETRVTCNLDSRLRVKSPRAQFRITYLVTTVQEHLLHRKQFF